MAASLSSLVLRATAGAVVLTVVAVGCGTVVSPLGPPGTPAPTSASSSVLPPAAPSGAETSVSASPTAAQKRPAPRGRPTLRLPRGGVEVFPRFRLVGYAGLTGAGTLGRLGTGDLDQRVTELEHRARPYAQNRQVLPVLEVIATVVHADPGADGRYRSRMSDGQIGRYLRAARRHRALLLLNIQPGRARFLDETKAYARWLQEPDVGVALDPEWAMGPGQQPGHAFGHTTGNELDAVAGYLSQLVHRHHLPEKVLVYHQLTPRIVRAESQLHRHGGVAVVKSVDGIGVRGSKLATYRRVTRSTPAFVHAGFKLFYDEDRHAGPLMTPRQVLALHPKPEYVLYE